MRGANLIFLLVLGVLGFYVWQNRKALQMAAAGGTANTVAPPANLPAAQPGTPGGVDPTVAAVTGTVASLTDKLLEAFAKSQGTIQTNASSTGGFDTSTGIPWRPS